MRNIPILPINILHKLAAPPIGPMNQLVHPKMTPGPVMKVNENEKKKRESLKARTA